MTTKNTLATDALVSAANKQFSIMQANLIELYGFVGEALDTIEEQMSEASGETEDQGYDLETIANVLDTVSASIPAKDIYTAASLLLVASRALKKELEEMAEVSNGAN